MTTSDHIQKTDYFSLFARIALALSFLSAVADRLGWWTPLLGSENVTWGNMESFIAYTATLVPWVPNMMLPLLGWLVTIAEVVLGVLLLVGYQKRIVALFSGLLLLAFACSMLVFASYKAPLDYSVFSAAACAFLLYKNAK